MHVQVHFKAAGGTGWTASNFMFHDTEHKLSSAHDASEALFSGFYMAIAVNRL